MKVIRQMKSTYLNLEHLHHKHGLALHLSVFVFSLLLGVGIGVIIFTVNAFQAKLQLKEMKEYEAMIMEKIVKKIEAAPITSMPQETYPSTTKKPQ